MLFNRKQRIVEPLKPSILKISIMYFIIFRNTQVSIEGINFLTFNFNCVLKDLTFRGN